MPTPRPAAQPTALENVIADEIRTARIEAIEAMPAVERRVFCKLLEFLSQPDDDISRGGTLTRKEALAVLWFRTLDDDEKAVAMRFLDQLDGANE